jgi:NitT/TauT family transport system substrate-binding protein
MKGKRLSLWIFMIIVFFSILPGKLFGEGAEEGVKKEILKILVPQSTSSFPILLLAQEDPLLGIDIQAETFINHPRALALLLRGEVDLLLTGTSQGWNNYLDGSPIVMMNTGVWGVSYLIGKDALIKNFSDLKRKRIALPFPGSPLDFQTRYILRKKGLDPDKDVQLSYSPFGQTVPKLIAGQIDVAPLPEPLATDMVTNKGLLRLIDYKEAWAEVSGGDPLSPQVSLFATKTFSQQHQETLKALIDQWRTASQTVTEHPGEIARQFPEVLSMPASVIEPAIQNTLFFVPSIPENRDRVISYYNTIREFLPESGPALAEDFFFSPPPKSPFKAICYTQIF